MIRSLIKFLLFTILVTIVLAVYLSLFGITTEKFNDQIKSKFLNINTNVNIELKKVKYLLNPLDLSISIKTFEPKILINNHKLQLEYIKTNIALKLFIGKTITIKDLNISTKSIEINKLILLLRSLKDSKELFILNTIIKDGYLIGDIKLNFDVNGKIKDDYEIKGLIKKVKLDILRKYKFDDLNFIFNIKNKNYNFKDINVNYDEIELSSESVKINENNNQYLISGKLKNKKKNIEPKYLKNLFGKKILNYSIDSLIFESNNDFSFVVNKKLKFSNFELKSTINLDKLIYKNNLKSIRKYVPTLEDSIQLKNHQISLNYKKNNLNIRGKGKIVIEDSIDNLNYKIDKKDNRYFFDTSVNINKNPIMVDILKYSKSKDVNSTLRLKGDYVEGKKIKFESILYIENKNILSMENLHLDNDFNILDLKKLKLDYFNNNKIKNQINLKKEHNNFKIYGKSFDITKIIDLILDSDNENTKSLILNSLKSNLSIKIDKTYLDKVEFVNNLFGNIYFKDNKINKLRLESFFSTGKKLTLSINTNENDEKITTLFSDYPKPLVKRYKFIKGFEEGILDFYSIKKNNKSKSVLKIDNFKLQEVPVLAKLLTLASLQGIADILTGEGIRFTDFEMNFSNTKELMTIEEIYAIGPAISILMDGYIESNKLVSLRGTLVPATTINRTIASIPFIGNILVGKKVGEGVFGVSFKVKGTPKNLKTTVNPVKTLTPRFITRTLEKIKKN